MLIFVTTPGYSFFILAEAARVASWLDEPWNWTGPATSASGLQITIVQQGLDTNFSFYYSEKGWVAGTIVGKNVTIPGHIGTVGKSPYPDLGTGARAPPCTKLTFAGLASRFWCKYPFCPHAMPPQPAPPSL